jgi:MFS family permease
MITTMGAILTTASSFLTLYIVDGFGASEGVAASLLALFYSAGIWAAPLGGRLADRFGRKRVAATVAIVAAAGLWILPRVPFGFGFAAVLVVLGATFFARMPPRKPISWASCGEPAVHGAGIYYFLGWRAAERSRPCWAVGSMRTDSCRLYVFGLGLGGLAAACSLVLFAADRSRRVREAAA